MEQKNEHKNPDRRKFIETGVTAGIGVALGLVIVNTLPDSTENKAPEMVKMLTPDGKLVLVEKHRLPQSCGNPVAVSNQELKEWMTAGKE